MCLYFEIVPVLRDSNGYLKMFRVAWTFYVRLDTSGEMTATELVIKTG